MARDDSVIGMDFMGVGKSAGARDCQGTPQSDQATLIRPTPTFPTTKDHPYNWQSSLPGVQPTLKQRILPQGASAAFGHPPISFLKPKGSSQAKEGLPSGRAISKQCSFSEKPSLEKPLEELTAGGTVQITRDECPRYLKERGMWCPPSNHSQSIQQLLSVNDCNKEDAFPNYSVHAAVKDPFLPSQEGPSSTRIHNSNFRGNSKKNLSQPADQAFASICNKSSDLLTSSELTLSLASAWDKGPRLPRHGGFDSSLPALSASSRGFSLSAFDVNQHTTESAISPLLNVSDPRVSSRPPATQLTIFYSGLVNVYDNVPADKAQAIMLMADSGSSRTSLMNVPEVGNLLSIPVVERAPATPANSTMGDRSQDLAPPNLPATVAPAVTQAVRHAHTELPQARKASLQRFLEKRKERAHARAPYAEKNPESDGSLPASESCKEKFPSPGKTLEAWSDSPVRQPPVSPSPPSMNKRSYPTCEPSSPSKAPRITQPNSLNEQEKKEATGLVLEKKEG